MMSYCKNLKNVPINEVKVNYMHWCNKLDEPLKKRNVICKTIERIRIKIEEIVEKLETAE